MARARNIKPSLFKNEVLGVLDPLITLLFESLWCLADREGRLEDRPLRIKAETFPYREGLDVNGYLTVLEQYGFIARYEVAGQRYIQVINFEKHQSPHKTEKASEIPTAPTKSSGCALTVNAPLLICEIPAALPPDSLIPDSLIPDSSTPAPQPSASKRPPVLFKTFLLDCKAKNEKPISTYKPIFDYAQSISLPHEFVGLCWDEFYRRYNVGGTAETKKYADWRKAFRKCVEGNWFKLWWLNQGTGKFELTTAGHTAQRAAA